MRINNLSMGIRIGKESIAMSVPLLFAFDAIADIIEKVDAKATAPKPSAAKKDDWSIIGNPELIVKKISAIIDKKSITQML